MGKRLNSDKVIQRNHEKELEKIRIQYKYLVKYNNLLGSKYKFESIDSELMKRDANQKSENKMNDPQKTDLFLMIKTLEEEIKKMNKRIDNCCVKSVKRRRSFGGSKKRQTKRKRR